MSTYTAARDKQRVEVTEDRSQYCRAPGCPNRWSMDEGDGQFCRFHFRQPKHLWEQITGEQLDAEVVRDNEFHRQRNQEPVKLSFAEKREVVARLALVCAAMRVGGSNPRAWIASLQARQAAGERLNDAQRHCLATATENRSGAVLGGSEADPDRDEQLRRQDAKREQLERVQQYAKENGVAL